METQQTKAPTAPVLDRLETLSPDHKLVLANNGRHFPTIKAGDYAVADTADTEWEDGELYVIRQGGQFGAPERLEIWRLDKCDMETNRPCVTFNPTVKQDFHEAMADADRDAPGFETPLGKFPILNFYLSDGPYPICGLPDIIFGRVVGVYAGEQEAAVVAS